MSGADNRQLRGGRHMQPAADSHTAGGSTHRATDSHVDGDNGGSQLARPWRQTFPYCLFLKKQAAGSVAQHRVVIARVTAQGTGLRLSLGFSLSRRSTSPTVASRLCLRTQATHFS